MGRVAILNLPSILLLVLFVVCPVSAAIPYSPSHILLSSKHDESFAYLFRPSDSNQNFTQFLSLDISGDVDTANPQYTVLVDEVPFRTNNHSSAIVPVIDQDGIIKVYAGNCHKPLDQAVLWQFSPTTNSSAGNGTWEQVDVVGMEGDANNSIYGPNYLAAGFAWAPSNTTSSSVYTFGGMCPFRDPQSTWIYAANYSQSMIVLDPPGSSSNLSYQISTAGQRAPPIPEAGFTITPLQSTYGVSSAGRTLQQQDFLLIGGHTQQAFLNMSELAIYSLPQDSWSFVTVNPALGMGKTELTVRDTPVVEPRSGHTATLSPDGSKVIVFGGWVGNTGVPAEPQLAILEMGADYGGIGAWTWSVPATNSTGLADGTGIYGHGATMLPGGVMMIAGGYSISNSSKRSTTGSQHNSQVYLYNVTSSSWVTSYVNPSQQNAISSAEAEAAAASKSTKAGLGAGLGLGIPAAAALAVFWFYFLRRRVRRTRDKELRKLALGAQRSHFWGRDEPEMTSSIRMPKQRDPASSRSYPWIDNRDAGGPSNWRGDESGEAAADPLLESAFLTPQSTQAGGELNYTSIRPPPHPLPKKPPSTSAQSTTLSRDKRSSSDSFSTAHTTLSLRQAEGEYLLREEPEPATPIERPPSSLLPSPSPPPAPKSKVPGWVGSVRRVLSAAHKRIPMTQESRIASLASGIDRRSTVLGSKGTSEGSETLPRRAVSASAELFRRKQGARDWGASSSQDSHETAFQTARNTRDNFALDGLVDFDEDEYDWDVEGAAEGRRVQQVTFTVPKEKLRVVNASARDMDALSEKSISRSNSGA